MDETHTSRGVGRWVAVALISALLALILGPNGPAGGFWGANGEDPTGGPLAALISYSLFEAVGFGVGIAFAAFGLPLLRSRGGSDRLTVFTYLAIVWSIVSWWPHGAFHQAIEHDNFVGLAIIEWSFHATVLLSVVVIGIWFARALNAGSSAAEHLEHAA